MLLYYFLLILRKIEQSTYDYIKAEVIVGENLSYKDEKIIKGKPEELENMSFGELTVVYINRNLLLR